MDSPSFEILLPRPFDHGFDYALPQGMAAPPIGSYVSVPFGKSEMVGVVWGDGKRAAPQCKMILAHHAHLPPMPEPFCRFLERSAAYNMQPLGSFLKMALPLPPAITQPLTQTHYRILNKGAGRITPQRARLLEAVDKGEQPISSAILSSMVKAGMLAKEERIAAPEPIEYTPALHPLTPEQCHAAAALRSAGFRVSVLDGVTGSGKTEVYFDAIAHGLAQHAGQMLVLLPEIALTHQWMARFAAQFGAPATLWHSSLTPAQRRLALQQIMNGAARVVVGARSALYLPYADLQLIIVDEEHDHSFKQEEGVIYQARDMAVLRGSIEQIPVVLASATPSLETLANIEAGKYQHVMLPQRFGAQSLAPIELIDLRDNKPYRGAFISPLLRTAILEKLAAGEQSLLFLNRRGYAPLLLCRSCGHRFSCRACDSWMVAHKHPPALQCHHCGRQEPLPQACPSCGDKEQLVPCGPGVERIAEEVASFLPEARLAQLSSDDAGLAENVAAIENGAIDIIIGTQLIAKGHHFPKLTLVGVIDADLGLTGGDLRASEHTYQLLQQVSGRAGREAAGQVLLQTVQPQHAVMQALALGDRDAFNQMELSHRELGQWPPFGRLAALLFTGKDDRQVQQAAMLAARSLPAHPDIRVLGPAPAPLARLRHQYRYRLLLKSPRQLSLSVYLHSWKSAWQPPKGISLKVDIDPYNFI